MRAEAEFLSAIGQELSYLRRYAHLLARDEDLADDLVQDTLLRAWRFRGNYQASSSVRTWLVAIMRNQYFSTRRKLERTVICSDLAHEDILAVPDTGPDLVDLDDLARRVERSFLKMRPRQRAALFAFCVEGLSYEQIAAQLNCPIGTVRSTIARGRAALRAMVGVDRVETLNGSIDPGVMCVDSDSDSETR